MSEERHARAFERLERAMSNAQNEAEVRDRWTRALESATGLTFDLERGWRDLSYNDVIIEFKDKGLFQGRKNSAAFKNATEDRLPKYIRRAAEADELAQEDYVGIAIDGAHVAFGQMRKGAFQAGRLMPVSRDTFGMVARACLSGRRRAVTSENLVADFGHRSTIGHRFMQALADALARALADGAHPKARKVQMLFKE